MSRADNLKKELFKKGVHVKSKDVERGLNEGLSDREIMSLFEENSSPWGLSSFRNMFIGKRARDAGHK